MSVRPVLLIGGAPTRRPDLNAAILTELHRVEQRRGQLIAAVDEHSGAVLGTLGLLPEPDEGGRCFHLAGLQVDPGPAAADTEVLLMEAAAKFLASRKVTRLKFATTPLLTRTAWLHVNRFGSHYRWRDGSGTPEGRPWPAVSVECDFDDPLERPLDLSPEEVPARCLLTWEGGVPAVRREMRFSGPLCVSLPDIDAGRLSDLSDKEPDVISTVWSVFHSLHVHGYEFAWFDSLTDAPGDPGTARWYYLMTRIVSL